jgi:subtilase family serine protease
MAINWKATVGALLVSVVGSWIYAQGQTIGEIPRPLSRIVQPVNDARLVQLRGNTRPLSKSQVDLGTVDSQLPMQRMLLILQRSPEQEAALEAFMARQLNPSSPDFHHWLDPEEFGALFGPSENDILTVTSWLQSRGFSVDNVSKGRVYIEFSGTAGLVRQAFHTDIHRFRLNGEEHIANISDPSIPEAISPVVAGVFSLNNFFTKPLHHDGGSFRRDAKTGKWTPLNDNVMTRPLFTVPLGSNPNFELVSPYDFATIYNVLPLWNAGIDGTGQTIAIAGRSDISLTDVATFRSAFGLPAKAPTIIVNGTDPGIPSDGDKVENTLDVEWSGAVAKGATIKFVTTASTSSTDGAVTSAFYIIDNKVAPVMSFSYGLCELYMGTAGNAAANSMWQQGAAEGITEFVATGDQGSAVCDAGGSPPTGAVNGLAVSGLSTTPYNVAVGGTDLNWANNSGTAYWNTTNATNGSSALGYMPEVPWNGTCVSDAVDKFLGATQAGYDEEQTCQVILNSFPDLQYYVSVVGGSGGVSNCTTPSGTTAATCSGGYAKPSWQTGTGVPADGKRDVPDVSLFASSGALYSAYIICDSQTTPCTFTDANDALAQSIGGTSVASPAMAGIMALVNQKMGSSQGNANAGFYALAARDNRSTCNSVSVAAGNACNFYDVTTDNNAVPCSPGTPNCTVHHTGDTYGVLNGYTSTTGYDLTTGLGTVNANNLVNNWHLVVATQQKPTATTGAASSIAATAATIAASVNPNGADTHTVFAYGTSSTLSGASTTTSLDVGSGTTVVGISVSLSGLIAGTKYYYQIQATNSAGTTSGAINSFTTAVTKPTATTGAASSITVTSATIAASVNPNGADTHMVFAYGTSSTLSGASTTGSLDVGSGTSAVGVSVPLTGLTAGTKYYYQIQATNSAGTTNGAINSFTTLATATPPTATTGAASSITTTTATVAGSVNPNGTDTHVVFAYGTNSTLLDANTTTSLDVGSGTTPVGISVQLSSLTAGTKYYYQVQAGNISGYSNAVISSFTTSAAPPPPSGYEFIPVSPCRVADTRNATGPFGGPQMTAKSTREFDIPHSACGIPSTAVAYSLNVTVVPSGPLGYLSMWPTGQTQPLVSTLNSIDGRVKANAAITPAGTNGGVNVYVTDPTNVILDIDGYFVPEGMASALAFYPVTPCRVVDTRNPNGTLGGPTIGKQTSRNFPVQSSSCGIPAAATAYSLNVTAVPKGPLGYLTIWPTGATQPVVSTLNSYSGGVVANASIVPAGTSGQVSVYVSDASDVVMDINGYFAPPGPGGLALYTVAPCRALDTRTAAGAFTGVLAVNIKGSTCAPPATAQAYVLNATVVPAHPLGYLSLWPDTETQPLVSTLNAIDGAVTSNMAIVPTLNGSIDAYSTDPTDLILDISSYFAQCAICTTTGWVGQVQCVKTVTGPSYRNNETQTWTVAPGIPQAPTGQTLYPTQWVSTGTGSTASQTWVTNASGTGQLTVFVNGSGINFARYSAEIVAHGAIQATPPPSYDDYEYQWLAFGNSDPKAQHVQNSSTLTSPTCDSPVEPGGSSCTVTCSWNFTKQ